MLTRIAHFYIWLLLALELVLFGVSLLLHVAMLLTGVSEGYRLYTHLIFGAAVLVGISGTPLLTDHLQWVPQIKRCPRWMWRTALAVGVYAMCFVAVQMIIPHDSTVGPMPLVLSVSAAALSGITFLIFPLVRREVFEDAQLVERASSSVILSFVISIVFWAYRAGYLAHAKR